MSSYSNPYMCVLDRTYVQSLGENRFKIEASGSCVRVLKDEPLIERSLDLKEVVLKAFNAIFNDHESVEIDWEEYLVERTPRAELRLVGSISTPSSSRTQTSPLAELRRRGRGIGFYRFLQDDDIQPKLEREGFTTLERAE